MAGAPRGSAAVRDGAWTPAMLFSAHGRHLQCDLCPHRCRLRDGQVGYCGVRRRSGDILETATFGTTVEHLDPVERKPLYHWRPGTRVLTYAAPGCSFRCDYCVNYRLSQFGREGGQPWQAEPADPGAMVQRAADLNAALAFSYSEPSLAIELTVALSELGASRQIPVIWKTNGFLTPAAAAVAATVVAAVNIDIKTADPRLHVKLTGAPLAPVLRTLEEFRAHGVWVEVATPLIPGFSDQPDQLAAIASTLASIDPAMPWHLLRFTPTFRMSGHDPASPEALAAAQRIGYDAGLDYVYVERALGASGRQTRCPSCSAPAVDRDIWATDALYLNDGNCGRCGRRIEGVWQ